MSLIPGYQAVVRVPNPMKNRNPLKQTTSSIISLEQRVNELMSYKKWQVLMDEYREKDIKFNLSLRPIAKNIKLKLLEIDVDIQRALDRAHCTKIGAIGNFDPRLMQVIYCVKTPAKEEYHAVDGQHTSTLVAAMVAAGLFADATDWKEVEIPVLYIETNSRSFARKAFALINGRGKKRLSPWYLHRCKVLSVRIDGSKDKDDIEAEEKQTISETYDCYAVESESQFVGKPGTFIHMEAFNLSRNALKIACKFHNDYFHYDEIDGSLWFMMNDIVKSYDAASIDITDKFLEELSGIIQGYFGGLKSFHDAVHKAHASWGLNYYGFDKFPWQDDAIACVLISLYQRLGGQHPVPKFMVDRFDKILNYIDEDIKDLIKAAS